MWPLENIIAMNKGEDVSKKPDLVDKFLRRKALAGGFPPHGSYWQLASDRSTELARGEVYAYITQSKIRDYVEWNDCVLISTDFGVIIWRDFDAT